MEANSLGVSRDVGQEAAWSGAILYQGLFQQGATYLGECVRPISWNSGGRCEVSAFFDEGVQ